MKKRSRKKDESIIPTRMVEADRSRLQNDEKVIRKARRRRALKRFYRENGRASGMIVLAGSILFSMYVAWLLWGIYATK